MPSFNLVHFFEDSPPDSVSFKPSNVYALGLAPVQQTHSSQADELVLLKRLWQELHDLPACERDAGVSHLLMRLCQLLQAWQADWCLHEGLLPSPQNMIAQGAVGRSKVCSPSGATTRPPQPVSPCFTSPSRLCNCTA